MASIEEGMEVSGLGDQLADVVFGEAGRRVVVVLLLVVVGAVVVLALVFAFATH